MFYGSQLPAACTFLPSSLPLLSKLGSFRAETWSRSAFWLTPAVEKRSQLTPKKFLFTLTGEAPLKPRTSWLLQISLSLRCSSMSGARCFSHWAARFTTRLALASTRAWRRKQRDAVNQRAPLTPTTCCQRFISQPTWSFKMLLSASGSRSIVFFFTWIFSSFSAFPSSLCFSSSTTFNKNTPHMSISVHLGLHSCSYWLPADIKLYWVITDDFFSFQRVKAQFETSGESQIYSRFIHSLHSLEQGLDDCTVPK